MRRPILSPRLLGALAAAALLLPAAARATTYTAPQIISTFNVVTSGNLATQSDVEGSAVIGGALSGGTFFNNDVPSTPVVYLGGNQTGNTTLDTGTLYYSGTLAGVNLNSGATKVQGSYGSTISAITSALNAYSTQLGGSTQQAGNSYSYSSGKLTFTATQGDSNGDAYVSISLATLQSDLSSANSLAFSLGGTAQTLIINVAGTGSFDPSSGLNFANQNPTQNVLFNFESATSLTIGTWYTSILAPDAAVSTGNAFDGFIYAASLQAGGELHNFPVTSPLPPVKKVPEPATLGLLAAGLAALGVRRRRAATRP